MAPERSFEGNSLYFWAWIPILALLAAAAGLHAYRFVSRPATEGAVNTILLILFTYLAWRYAIDVAWRYASTIKLADDGRVSIRVPLHTIEAKLSEVTLIQDARVSIRGEVVHASANPRVKGRYFVILVRGETYIPINNRSVAGRRLFDVLVSEGLPVLNPE